MPYHSNVTPELYEYMLSVSLREPEILAELRKETATLPRAGMQITPDEGQLLAFLVELIGARKIIDVGTFTGYSAIAMAYALPPGGKVITLDIDPEVTAVAKRTWERAGLGDRIELRLAPALETLGRLNEAGEAGTFDLVFLDAGDKLQYIDYYETSLSLLRQGGLLVIDNVLFGGRVVPSVDVETIEREEFRNNVKGVRIINEHVHKDERVSLTMLAISDGVTIARKR